MIQYYDEHIGDPDCPTDSDYTGKANVTLRVFLSSSANAAFECTCPMDAASQNWREASGFITPIVIRWDRDTGIGDIIELMICPDDL